MCGSPYIGLTRWGNWPQSSDSILVFVFNTRSCICTHPNLYILLSSSLSLLPSRVFSPWTAKNMIIWRAVKYHLYMIFWSMQNAVFAFFLLQYFLFNVPDSCFMFWCQANLLKSNKSLSWLQRPLSGVIGQQQQQQQWMFELKLRVSSPLRTISAGWKCKTELLFASRRALTVQWWYATTGLRHQLFQIFTEQIDSF